MDDVELYVVKSVNEYRGADSIIDHCSHKNESYDPGINYSNQALILVAVPESGICRNHSEDKELRIVGAVKYIAELSECD